MTKYGYIRIYENSNSIERQKDELQKFIDDDKFIFVDTKNGKSSFGDKYVSLKKVITKGDELYIKSFFSLGDNVKQIKSELMEFKKNKIIITVLDIPSTIIKYSKFNGKQKLVSDIVTGILLDILDLIEEKEKKDKKQRQQDGIERSRTKGINGRPKIEYQSKWDDTYRLFANKKITEKEALKRTGLGRTKFYDFKKEFLKNQP